jgi:uncharacterized protein with PQ loop repeat
MTELDSLGWNPKTISSIGTVVFGILGSYGLIMQALKIWRGKSALSVSTPWSLIFTFMFAAYLIRGLDMNSAVMIAQGALRVIFYLPVIIGILWFKGFSRSEWALTVTFIMLMTVMIVVPKVHGEIFIFAGILGIAGVTLQGMTIWKNKTAGAVSLNLLVIYTLSIIFWIWYAYQFQDVVLLVTSVLFLAAYFFTLIMWMKYPPVAKPLAA